MEVVYSLDFVVQFCWLPFCAGPPYPSDKILQSTAYKFGIQNLLNVVFLFAINFYRRRRGNNLTRQWMVAGRVEKGDILDTVDLHRMW